MIGNNDKSYNSIQSISEDWGLDERLGVPYSGQSVQNFIKEIVSEKVSAQYFDPITYILYSFKDEETKNTWIETKDSSLVLSQAPFVFTGVLNQIKILNEMGNTNLYYTTTSETAIIKTGFVSQQKGLTDTNWEEVFEDFYVTVAIDRGSTGNYTNIVEKQLVLNGNYHEVDVKKYLMNGSNRLRVSVEGVTTHTTSNLIFNITLTSMYLSPSNFSWHVPFVERSSYTIGGLLIGGTLNKILNIKVTGGDNYSKLYEVNLGANTYTTTPYFFSGMEFPGKTGIYHLDIWVSAVGDLESEHLHYNIMCIEAKDSASAKLVVMNEAAAGAINYSDNTLFGYACYDSGAATASPAVEVRLGSNIIISEVLTDVAAMSKQRYITNLEIESEATDMILNATISYGRTSESISLPVDNSASYPATSGASFYLNASSRSNAQQNFDKIVNAVDESEIEAEWSGMAWSEGADGWTTDNYGRKCLKLPALSKSTIKYQPFSSFGAGKTIELLYRISNAADYSEPIISICDDPTSKNFRGILIKPNNLLVHSRDLNAADNIQGYNFKDEELVHVVVTIIRNYKTTYGNFCIIYVNGVKKATFTFEATDSWVVNSNIVLGSDSADLYLYKARVYDFGFGFQDVINNFISCLPTSGEKIAMADQIQSIVDDSYNIDYAKIKDKYNTMVVEMLNGNELPHYGLNKKYEAPSNLWINIFNEDPKKVEQFGPLSGEYLNQNVSGQGTTSMNYWIWNLRWKKTPIRITAKKNYASSMQGHKMGATGAYNDLHDHVVGQNETGTRTAVYQYPCYGFQKILVDGTTDQYTYKYIGMYTIGPDKGDKNTFGMKDSTYKKQLMYMEGKDHPIKGVGMEYPYSELVYSLDEESLCVNKGEAGLDAAWEVAACPYETEEEIQAFLDQEFKPAYEVAYNNSTMIMGTSDSIDTINADPTAWGLKKDEDGHAYQRYQIWLDGEYDIYYLSVRTNKYEKDGCNLLKQLNISPSEIEGMSINEKNELFKSKRRDIFRAEMGNYWHLEDCLFCYIFLVLFGATDNFKKNSYPYKIPLLKNGGKWRWRQDDLDTIFDIDNQGHSTKHYAIEAHDWADDSKTAYVFKGEDSSFWRLLEECFPEEIQAMGSRVLMGMYELSTSGATTIDRLIGFIKTYFWDKAQLYFTKSAYNIDAETCYEDAYPYYKDGSYDVDVNPLEQSLGDHYEAEWNWVEKRMIYAMSKFGFGPFKEYTDTCLGRINFRTQLAQSFTLTPSMDMYPTILSGQGAALSSSDRTVAGEEVKLDGAGGTNTNVYIMAADYLRSLGDLKDLAVDVSTNASISIASKRLQTIKVGDEDASKVTSNLQTLSVGNCPSVSVIDARNLKSLTGTINLSGCPRLREALFGGTDIRSITLPNGSKISHIQLPESITVLSMSDMTFLQEEGFEYGSLKNVEFFRIESCEHLNPFELLKTIYNSDDNHLRDIRLIGFAYDGSADDVDILANLATNKDKDGNEHSYNGIDAEGNPLNTSLPVIEGTLNINGSIYQDASDIVTTSYPGLVLNVSDGYYVRFQDAEVQRIIANAYGDGRGIKMEAIEEVTNLGSMFNSNKDIVTFPELEKFVNVKSISDYAFTECTNLSTINLPKGMETIGKNAFEKCTNLSTTLPSSITTIGNRCFAKSGLSGTINLPNLTSIGIDGVFANTQIESIVNLGSITEWGDANIQTYGLASNCENLKSVTLPETLESIGGYSFYNNSSLETINLPETITYIGQKAFEKCPKLNLDYLDLPNLTALKSNAFKETNIKAITDLGNLKSLEAGVFMKCAGLEAAVLPEVLEEIGKDAFADCTNLTEINIPESLTKINNNAFAGCSKLVIDDLSLPNLSDLGQGAFDKVNITTISDLGQISSLPTANGNTGNYGNREVLTSIHIPENIVNIPAYSLYNYSQLSDVNLSENVVSIGKYAFYGCSNLELESLSLPSLKDLGEYSFAKSKVKSIDDLGEIVNINAGIFMSCSELGSVNLSGTIKSIGNEAFKDCTNLTSINLANVEVINPYSFMNCTSLNLGDLSLPNVTSIGVGAFNEVRIDSISGLDKLVRLVGHDSYSTWGSKEYLKSFEIPDHITEIPTSFLYDYKELTDVNIDHVTKIGDNAFYNCSKLVIGDLSLPNLESLGSGAFHNVKISYISNLGNITKLPEGSSNIRTYGSASSLLGITIPEVITSIPDYFLYGYSNVTSCNIPSNITEIGTSAFNLCSSLEIDDLNLPNLKTIGKTAFTRSKLKSISNLGSITELPNGDNVNSGIFYSCTNLEHVTLPDTLKTIGKYTFGQCTKLGKLIVPDSVTSIGERALYQNSSMTKLYLGSGIEMIDSCAFMYCTKLDTVVSMASIPPAINSDTFSNVNPSFILYVPDSSVNAYKVASNWTAFSDRIKGISELEDQSWF